MKRIITFLLILLLFPISSFSQKAASSTKAGVQRNAEKGLKDNRYFLYYINFTISNYGTAEEKQKYEDIIKRDILSQFFYLRFIFGDAYKNIRIAQKNLIDLYKAKIESETIAIKQVINDFAPLAINSQDAKAKHYLRMGYRELTYSRIEATMSDNYKLTLYSMRLYKYVRSLKHLKEAKRYAFLARIRIDLSENEKIKDKRLTFSEIEEKINLFATDDKKDFYKLMHYDSYYKCPNGKSDYDKIWENPRLNEYAPFLEYRKLNL